MIPVGTSEIKKINTDLSPSHRKASQYRYHLSCDTTTKRKYAS